MIRRPNKDSLFSRCLNAGLDPIILQINTKDIPMAIHRGDKARGGGKHQITVEEFRKWLMSFDLDKDGRISQGELRAAIRSCGVWFTTWKSGRGMREADSDGSGYIDEDEIDYLLDFAEKSMGFQFN